ncbi:diguanylate cyclase [Pseudomonas sp. CDFA 602]|uniref:bifunctional diguanylate cyclase/phosphodiesterase n=1 Tax=Pseudomonas californiensis TaxID=2829823 RepID=UPI001E47180B|nr:diguanylate cyclase [Pseudomonas californiensis]MCD5994860.1 diguanylate cyclase [Pseudomonas californiensis]MCD6000509.1 diguanylate cyclase [Pseudomonas californiensis]
MLKPVKPENEEARLRLLHNLKVLDTAPEAVFDRITRVVSQLLGVPIALVSLIDADRQWFKSNVGLDASETSRDLAFCAHALHVPDLLIVEDAKEDPRFCDSPLVLGSPGIRFYAGVPLRSSEGLALGTLCAIDTVPRTLSADAIGTLKDLAGIVERELLQRATFLQGRDVFSVERQARTLSEARFAAVFRQTPTGNAIIDLTGRFMEVNAKLCEITGFTEQELLAKTVADVTHPADIDIFLSLTAELVDNRRDSGILEKRYWRHDGSFMWVELSVSLLRDNEGQPLHFIAVVLDITIRKRTEGILLSHQEELERRVTQRTQELHRSRETLQIIADNLPILIAQVDLNLRYLFNNAVYTQIFGVTPEYLKGKSIRETLRPDLFAHLEPCFTRALNGERSQCADVCYNPDQGRLWRATYIPDIREGKVVGFFVMSQDVTEARHVERALHDKAMLDTLTGLPNRRSLLELLQRDIQPADATPDTIAVLFMDLDGFKTVNDQHGHDAGDDLLKQVAARLTHTLRQQDFVSRLAGDEFVAVIAGMQSEETCARIAVDICASLSQPFKLPAATVRIGVSIGIALGSRAQAESSEHLLKRADAAMYEAKRKGRNTYRFG